jgi:hypothetical protein
MAPRHDEMSPYDQLADLIEGVLAGRMSAAEAIVETEGFPTLRGMTFSSLRRATF